LAASSSPNAHILQLGPRRLRSTTYTFPYSLSLLCYSCISLSLSVIKMSDSSGLNNTEGSHGASGVDRTQVFDIDEFARALTSRFLLSAHPYYRSLWFHNVFLSRNDSVPRGNRLAIPERVPDILPDPSPELIGPLLVRSLPGWWWASRDDSGDVHRPHELWHAIKTVSEVASGPGSSAEALQEDRRLARALDATRDFGESVEDREIGESLMRLRECARYCLFEGVQDAPGLSRK